MNRRLFVTSSLNIASLARRLASSIPQAALLYEVIE